MRHIFKDSILYIHTHLSSFPIFFVYFEGPIFQHRDHRGHRESRFCFRAQRIVFSSVSSVISVLKFLCYRAFLSTVRATSFLTPLTVMTVFPSGATCNSRYSMDIITNYGQSAQPTKAWPGRPCGRLSRHRSVLGAPSDRLYHPWYAAPSWDTWLRHISEIRPYRFMSFPYGSLRFLTVFTHRARTGNGHDHREIPGVGSSLRIHNFQEHERSKALLLK